MLVLAFDTTNEKGGVGIFRDAACLALVPNEGSANRYSVTLFEIVEQALAKAHVQLDEIELFAAANGPGSFTGIRVGLAAARAWGKAFERPVRGVSVLEAMVDKTGYGTRDTGYGIRDTGDGFRDPGLGLPRPAVRAGVPPNSESGAPSAELTGPEWVFPFLDARRGEFFLGSFRRKAAGLSGAVGTDYEQADGGWVFTPKALRIFVEARVAGGASAACLVRAHDQAAFDLRTSLPSSIGWQRIDGALVDSIAAIALRAEQAGDGSAEATLDAYYLRRPDAEINWKD